MENQGGEGHHRGSLVVDHHPELRAGRVHHVARLGQGHVRVLRGQDQTVDPAPSARSTVENLVRAEHVQLSLRVDVFGRDPMALDRYEPTLADQGVHGDPLQLGADPAHQAAAQGSVGLGVRARTFLGFGQARLGLGDQGRAVADHEGQGPRRRWPRRHESGAEPLLQFLDPHG